MATASHTMPLFFAEGGIPRRKEGLQGTGAILTFHVFCENDPTIWFGWFARVLEGDVSRNSRICSVKRIQIGNTA